MPSETPKMPEETHMSLLRHGESRALALRAYEVAEFAKPKTGRIAGLTLLGVGAALGAALVAIIGGVG